MENEDDQPPSVIGEQCKSTDKTSRKPVDTREGFAPRGEPSRRGRGRGGSSRPRGGLGRRMDGCGPPAKSPFGPRDDSKMSTAESKQEEEDVPPSNAISNAARKKKSSAVPPRMQRTRGGESERGARRGGRSPNSTGQVMVSGSDMVAPGVATSSRGNSYAAATSSNVCKASSQNKDDYPSAPPNPGSKNYNSSFPSLGKQSGQVQSNKVPTNQPSTSSYTSRAATEPVQQSAGPSTTTKPFTVEEGSKKAVYIPCQADPPYKDDLPSALLNPGGQNYESSVPSMVQRSCKVQSSVVPTNQPSTSSYSSRAATKPVQQSELPSTTTKPFTVEEDSKKSAYIPRHDKAKQLNTDNETNGIGAAPSHPSQAKSTGGVKNFVRNVEKFLGYPCLKLIRNVIFVIVILQNNVKQHCFKYLSKELDKMVKNPEPNDMSNHIMLDEKCKEYIDLANYYKNTTYSTLKSVRLLISREQGIRFIKELLKVIEIYPNTWGIGLWFHGTKEKNLYLIRKEGLKNLSNRGSAHKLGPGIYFAENLILPMSFTDKFAKSSGKLNTILGCLVIIGNAELGYETSDGRTKKSDTLKNENEYIIAKPDGNSALVIYEMKSEFNDEIPNFKLKGNFEPRERCRGNSQLLSRMLHKNAAVNGFQL